MEQSQFNIKYLDYEIAEFINKNLQSQGINAAEFIDKSLEETNPNTRYSTVCKMLLTEAKTNIDQYLRNGKRNVFSWAIEFYNNDYKAYILLEKVMELIWFSQKKNRQNASVISSLGAITSALLMIKSKEN